MPHCLVCLRTDVGIPTLLTYCTKFTSRTAGIYLEVPSYSPLKSHHKWEPLTGAHATRFRAPGGSRRGGRGSTVGNGEIVWNLKSHSSRNSNTEIRRRTLGR